MKQHDWLGVLQQYFHFSKCKIGTMNFEVSLVVQILVVAITSFLKYVAVKSCSLSVADPGGCIGFHRNQLFQK